MVWSQHSKDTKESNEDLEDSGQDTNRVKDILLPREQTVTRQHCQQEAVEADANKADRCPQVV